MFHRFFWLSTVLFVFTSYNFSVLEFIENPLSKYFLSYLGTSQQTTLNSFAKSLTDISHKLTHTFLNNINIIIHHFIHNVTKRPLPWSAARVPHWGSTVIIIRRITLINGTMLPIALTCQILSTRTRAAGLKLLWYFFVYPSLFCTKR